MFECYLFSQLACTTVYRTPSENTVCTASLISRKRAVFPVPTVPQSPAWCRYRKSEWLHLFLFFLPYQKVVLWRVLFCFSFLLNSSWSHYFLVALLSLKADCPVLPPSPFTWDVAVQLVPAWGRQLTADHIYYAQFVHPLHFCSLTVHTDGWMVC